MSEISSENLIGCVEAHLQNKLKVYGTVGKYECKIRSNNQGEDIVIELVFDTSEKFILYYSKKEKCLLGSAGFGDDIKDDVPEELAMSLLQDVAVHFKPYGARSDSDREEKLDKAQTATQAAVSFNLYDNPPVEDFSDEEFRDLIQHIDDIRTMTIEEVIAKTLPIILRHDPDFEKKVGMVLRAEEVKKRLQYKGKVRAACINEPNLKHTLTNLADLYSHSPFLTDDDRAFISRSIGYLQEELGLMN